jgi:hypothetical protein
VGYTYTDLPQTVNRDAVRFLIQDTKNADGTDGGVLVTDAQIAFALAEEMNVYTAAAACCDALVSQAQGVSSRSVGDVSISYSVGFYEALGKRLRNRGKTYQGPFAGALTESDKDTLREDTDATQPDFTRDMKEYPGLSEQALDQERES